MEIKCIDSAAICVGIVQTQWIYIKNISLINNISDLRLSACTPRALNAVYVRISNDIGPDRENVVKKKIMQIRLNIIRRTNGGRKTLLSRRRIRRTRWYPETRTYTAWVGVGGGVRLLPLCVDMLSKTKNIFRWTALTHGDGQLSPSSLFAFFAHYHRRGLWRRHAWTTAVATTTGCTTPPAARWTLVDLQWRVQYASSAIIYPICTTGTTRVSLDEYFIRSGVATQHCTPADQEKSISCCCCCYCYTSVFGGGRRDERRDAHGRDRGADDAQLWRRRRWCASQWDIGRDVCARDDRYDWQSSGFGRRIGRDYQREERHCCAATAAAVAAVVDAAPRRRHRRRSR